MLDFSGEIYSWLTLSLRQKFPGIYTSKRETSAPPKFPAVNIVQKDNSTYKPTRDANIENHVSVMFQIEIFTNGENNDKQDQAESIRNEISDLMLSIGFNRTFCEPVPNIADMSIYRITMRFTGIIGKNRLVYS